MIDEDYFKTDLQRQIEQLGAGDARVEIHLHGGLVYSVRNMPEARTGYVLMEVYPTEGVDDDSKAARRKPCGTDVVYYDLVAIPYEAIAHVFLTVKGAPTRPTMGFGKA